MDYKLSIITTTYNSSEFIRDTIEGVLNQNIDFSFEYIVSDDGSTDNTLEIVNQMKQAHPKGDAIHIIHHDRNLGLMKNFFGAVMECRGEYIAFCDSDDIWTDPDKLTKQVEFLNKNKGCVISYHKFINKIDPDLDKELVKHVDEPIDKIIMNPQTSTMMVRGILRELVNKNVINETNSQNDQYLRFLLKDRGFFKPLNDIEPNIRLIRKNSIWSTVDKLTNKRVALQCWKTFYKYHGHGKNQRYLAKKVKGFQSAVNWLEYEKKPSPERYKQALKFDIENGVIIRKAVSRLRRIIFTPLVMIRDSVKKLLNS